MQRRPQPIAYFGLHGITDSVLNISSGRSLPDTFVRNNGCTAQSPREPASGSRTHITTAYSGCRAGYQVQWAAFDNGHLPGPVDGTYAESGITTWTEGEVWRFFSQFWRSRSATATPSRRLSVDARWPVDGSPAGAVSGHATGGRPCRRWGSVRRDMEVVEFDVTAP